jgi:hypothetical protein
MKLVLSVSQSLSLSLSLSLHRSGCSAKYPIVLSVVETVDFSHHLMYDATTRGLSVSSDISTT